jgi:diphthine-ammonia ligase
MAPSGVQTQADTLNVIALVSGGKDSFFGLLHCLANRHRVVALANLYPPAPPGPLTDYRPSDRIGTLPDTTVIQPGSLPASVTDHDDEVDLNSFMYQTVGHEVIPYYADATGIPVYRRPINGAGAVHDGKDYAYRGSDDETESMLPLLRTIIATSDPRPNALCAGAILSTYQRTRVESIAVRLGLVPLAYLWKYPVLSKELPAPGSSSLDSARRASSSVSGTSHDTQLLVDMAAVGLDARIVKVASAGLDESFLWENVASSTGVARVKRAMDRFGGSVLGEGGEFETLVVDGPRRLFRRKIVVSEAARKIVREGGGTAWLSVRGVRLEDKDLEVEVDNDASVRIPALLEDRFAAMLEPELAADTGKRDELTQDQYDKTPRLGPLRDWSQSQLQQWCFAMHPPDQFSSIEAEAVSVVDQIQARLKTASLTATAIISSVVILRRMSDFPTINKIYGSLFTEPNPPSRVTVSCGQLLPTGCNIVVYLSVHGGHLAPGDRQGLHVQSRSYWAPANIGPYSQASAVPLKSLDSSSSSTSAGDVSDTPCGGQLVYIAGQIPLLPATMELPTEPFTLQAALSLQHLWRIGVETKVQWWCSAIAYLPRGSTAPTSEDENLVTIREQVSLAAEVWRAAHAWERSSDPTDEDDEGAPDLWDRKYNPMYLSYATGGTGSEKKHCLPDLSILTGNDTAVPFFFAAEVMELPRQAEIEWHSHCGLASLEEVSVRILAGTTSDHDKNVSMQWQHTMVRSPTSKCFVHSILALRTMSESKDGTPISLESLLEELNGVMLRQLATLGSGTEAIPRPASANLLYVNTELVTGYNEGAGCPIIPCFSLWSSSGEKLGAVAMYWNVFHTQTRASSIA